MKYRILYLICSNLVFFSILFSSCISSEEVNYLQNIEVSYDKLPYEEYKLKSGDRISCAISSADEVFARKFNNLFSESDVQAMIYPIYEDGTIILPYLGGVEIMGSTMQEAEKKVQAFVQESISDAQVTLTLISNAFFVLSNGRQGSYVAYKENMTIYQALAIAGQTTEIMDLSKVKILRRDINGQTKTKTFDLRTKEVIQSEYYYIQPNDVIHFATNKNSYFNITSVGTFISAITVPLGFLLFVATYDF